MDLIEPLFQDGQIGREPYFNSLAVAVARYERLRGAVGFKDTEPIGVIGIRDAKRRPVRRQPVIVVFALVGEGNRDGMIAALSPRSRADHRGRWRSERW